MSVLETRDVFYSYTKGSMILSGINAVFETGKLHAILGPSGSGKTTLLSLLGGLVSPTKGKILFDGEDIAGHGLEYHRRQHVSLIFQSYNLIDYLTPVENVKLTARQDALPVLKRLGLSAEEAGRSVLKLSGGQQQRVAIGRALMNSPAVMLADEPTGSLDSQNSQEILRLLKESHRKYHQTLLLVTHDASIALQADRILTIADGRVVRDERRVVRP